MRRRPRSNTLLSVSFGAVPSFGDARRSTALTRSTRRRCEKGLRIKSSAPIFRPNNSSISSSFEVRKITGRGFLPQPTQSLHAVHARHLDIENGKIGRRSLETVEG